MTKNYKNQVEILQFNDKSIIIYVKIAKVENVAVRCEIIESPTKLKAFYLKGEKKTRKKSFDKKIWDVQKGRIIMNITDLYNQTEEWVLATSGQEDCVPVDLERILDVFSISTNSMDFSTIEERLTGDLENAKILGALVTMGNDTTIFYSDRHKKDSHRNRFTIAHEIAHCCIQGSNAHIEFRMDGIELDDLETEANIFAGALLIPEKALNKVIEQLILPSLCTLADIFEVSENVMLARLKHLNIQKNIVGYNV